jgi:hypothetical protein
MTGDIRRPRASCARRIGIFLLFTWAIGCDGGGVPDERLDELESLVAAQASEIDALEGRIAEQTTAVDGLATLTDGRIDALETTTDALSETTTTLSSESVRMLAEPITIAVPGDFEDLPSAIASLAGTRFGPGTTAEIQLADGTYTFDEPLSIYHPEGERLRIVGNVEHPEAVVLLFNGCPGLRVNNATLGHLDGVTIRSDGTDPNADGITVSRGSLTTGEHVVIEDFPSEGLVSNFQSVVTAIGAIARRNGRGFLAANGSTMIVDDAQAIDNTGDGFVASSAYLRAHRAVSRGNRDGFYAYFGASIIATEAVADENLRRGFNASSQSLIDASEASAVGNVLGIFASFESAIVFISGTCTESTGGEDLRAEVGSTIYLSDATFGTTTPPVNTVGNANSWIHLP